MKQSSNTRSGPLSHTVVLDLSTMLAGPYCTQILADLGARIIKLERMEGKGDFTRHLPPHFIKGTSAYFHSVNRNKESLVIDLKQPEGRDLFLQMVKHADIVVENYRPGVMERLGLGYDKLAEANPGIVLCSISGFGQTGPYRERPAFDMIVQGLSGSMSITGEAGRRPVRLGIPLGDLAAGMFGAIGALAALERRKVDGKGQLVDVSMLDCQVSMLSYLGEYCLVSGEVPGPQGRGHQSIPTYRSFTCGDDVDVVITANTEKMWQSLATVLGLPELIHDPRFKVNEDRFRNREALYQHLEPAFLKRPSAEWLELLQKADIPAAPVNTMDRAFADPQVRHRDMVVTTTHRDGTTMRLLGNPIKMSRTANEAYTWPPDLGEHTRSVLADFLHLKAEEIAKLQAGGVVHCGDGS
ncbi:MAG TPA: CoA transferase [Candidatus Sulfotelmatobacter sp.]|nr:CoA transferase [Candidatus Sulfotelmatobacter sp.]